MNITVIGTGYVGLVTGTIFAQKGNTVTCIDIDAKKIANLKTGISPIYEPGLEELITKNIRLNRLNFSIDISTNLAKSEVIFIGVGTPSRPDGSVNLDYVEAAATDIGQALAKLDKKQQFYRVIVNKSTVPIGTGDLVGKIISKFYSGKFDVVSNPEFLREGQAVNDCLKPDRIVIGFSASSEQADKARRVMNKLYSNFDCPKLYTDLKTAEMIKYASNAYLATSISFINSLAALCENLGADVSQVAAGMRLDKRIGAKAFLDAGPGYGGSCFPKDVKGLIDIAHQNNLSLPILESTEDVNITAKNRVIDKISQLIGSPKGKKIAILGLAFKAMTDDIRDAPVLPVLDWLIKNKAEIIAYDEVAKKNILEFYPTIKFSKTPYSALNNADLAVIMTEWAEFAGLDLTKVKRIMKTPKIVDARNIFGIDKMEKLGFEYLNIGGKR